LLRGLLPPCNTTFSIPGGGGAFVRRWLLAATRGCNTVVCQNVMNPRASEPCRVIQSSKSRSMRRKRNVPPTSTSAYCSRVTLIGFFDFRRDAKRIWKSVHIDGKLGG